MSLARALAVSFTRLKKLKKRLFYRLKRACLLTAVQQVMVVGLDPKTGSKYQPAYLLVHLEKNGLASHANVLRAL